MFLLALAACHEPDSYACDREVLEIAAAGDVPFQVVQCGTEGVCDPVLWWVASDTLVVPCDVGSEVLVWW